MKILFVCLGNICRSPTAEAVFRQIFAQAGIAASFDSAGTADYHVGELSDPRSIAHAERRGYIMEHLGRQVTRADFDLFDLVLAMDRSNHRHLLRLVQDSGQDAGQAPSVHSKLHLVTEILNDPEIKEVPDPYYGGAQEFEHVLDLLERCAQAWCEKFAP